MYLGPKLIQQQTQKLIMTPELRQAITVLQLSATELGEFIAEEVQNNPVLEIREEAMAPSREGAERAETAERNAGERAGDERSGEDRGDERGYERGDERGDERAGDRPGDDRPVGSATDSHEARAGENRFDVDWREYFHDRSDLGFVPAPERDPDRETRSLDNYVAEAPTLEDHLRLQLHLSPLNQGDRRIGEYLIGMLDDNGYLQTTLADAAKALKVSEEDVARVHRTFTTFDPPGVGARDLAECLRIQLDGMPLAADQEPVRGLAAQIIDRHLEDLGAGRLSRIASALGVPAKEVQGAADFIRTLDPKPGRRFGDPHDTRYIVPDVVIERVEDEYIVIVNDSAVPRLGINNYYRQLLHGAKKADGADGEKVKAREYVESKLNSALWLIRSIEQRRRTLYRVTETIVKLQREFLDRGLRYLRPMSLKQIAEIIGMHESTVSRATSNKYVQTPQGTFELKFFFTSGVTEIGASAGISSEGVKKYIQDLVDAEDPGHPLSDDALARMLGGRGIVISRRTVAKYRDEMGVQPSSRRRRL
ncbi:MAG TPA: RNA polymerase factor sigma-54 [Bacillota bacterium]|jgi:RNA polymerase sigma-54 factor